MDPALGTTWAVIARTKAVVACNGNGCHQSKVSAKTWDVFMYYIYRCTILCVLDMSLYWCTVSCLHARIHACMHRCVYVHVCMYVSRSKLVISKEFSEPVPGGPVVASVRAWSNVMRL